MKEEFKTGKVGIKNYLKYSGFGFQIAATIGAGVFIGYQTDKWLHTSKLYFTLGFSFLFVVLALFVGLKGIGTKD